MESNESVRSRVQSSYGKLVNQSSTSCCSGDTKGVAVQWADYSEAALGELPEDAVTNSFGCGNPLGFKGVKAGDTVLDLGSGAGIDLLLAASIVGPEGKVIGVDMTDEMIASAQKSIAESGHTNIEIRKGIIESLPVEDNSVDWVISNCVVNLSPDKEAVYREIFRVLKPGGQLSISDIVLEENASWLQSIPGMYESCLAGAISRAENEKLAADAGLTEFAIRDEVIYDKQQLLEFATSEAKPDDQGSSCGCTIEKDVASLLIQRLEGKVASVNMHARKP